MAGDPGRLVLAPDSERGWFGGRRLVATGIGEVREGQTLAEAGDALESAFHGEAPGATVALLRYDGPATVVRFETLADEEAGGASGPAAARATAFVPSPTGTATPAAPLLLDAAWDMSGRDYRAGVATTRERIAAGDVYVLNLTARLSGGLAMPPAEAFAALQARASSAMSAMLELHDGSAIVSASPERFVRVRLDEWSARVVEVCPIKGTRPRGATPEADEALASELLADPKERAEHVMVVDLERNDLGRVCAPGSVHVDPLYEVFGTPYCHQLVSSVRGTMREEATIAGLLAATFPCGSVTGAPKIAAIRIAAELERTPRGAYCGSLVVAMPGEIDSSVLIRTLECDADGRARWGTGGGITHDSDPAEEYLEALLKASPALGDAPPPVALRETMRVVSGRVPLLARHLARLAEGGCGPGVLARVRGAVADALAGGDAAAPYARLAITVTADGEVTAGLTADPSSLDVPGGVRLVPVEVPELPLLPPRAAKPASRRFWDRAHNAARLQGADQAALVLPNGTLVDGSTATVWLVRDGVLATPPAPPAISGVLRGLVFDIAHSLGITAEERSLTAADLAAADEVFLSNAVGGVALVRGREGQVGERIAVAVREALGE